MTRPRLLLQLLRSAASSPAVVSRTHAIARSSLPLSLVGLLALTGCDGAPIAPLVDTAGVPPQTLLEVSRSSTAMARRSQCVNNLKQMGLGNTPSRPELGLIVQDPSVELDRGNDGRAPSHVVGFLTVSDGGPWVSCGEVQVGMADGSVRFIIGSIDATWQQESVMLRLAGEAEFCPAGGGPCDRAGFTGEVNVTPAQGQAVFQLTKEDGSLYQFAARTYLLFPGQGQDGDRHTLVDGPTTLWMDGERIGSAVIRLNGPEGTAAANGGVHVNLAGGSVRVFKVLLGLLLREGDGYRWVLLLEGAGQGEPPATRLFGSELWLRSGAALQDDDEWILGGTVYRNIGGDWVCL